MPLPAYVEGVLRGAPKKGAGRPGRGGLEGDVVRGDGSGDLNLRGGGGGMVRVCIVLYSIV